MIPYDSFRWQAAVLASADLRKASKVIAIALALVADSAGHASVGVPQLAAMTSMSPRWVIAALEELVDDEKCVRRKRRGRRGRHTAEYVLLPEYVQIPAPTPSDSVNGSAPSRSDSVNGSAPSRSDSVNGSAPSRSDSVKTSAPLLRRREEQEEEEEQQRDVDERDVVRALEALPEELRPDGRAETAAMAGSLRERLAHGWLVDDLVDAAGFRQSDRPIGNRVRVLAHRVPLRPPPGTLLDLRRRPEVDAWCGQCDPTTRRPLDEYGYVDTTQPRGSCQACQTLSFEAHMVAR